MPIRKMKNIRKYIIYCARNLFVLHSYIFLSASRTEQGMQREPSVKTLRSPLSAEFCRHCMISGGTQRRAFARHQSEIIKI